MGRLGAVSVEYNHIPVLEQEVVAVLCWRRGGRYVDATVGSGGHALALLEVAGPDAQLVAFDQDESALAAARRRLQAVEGQVTFIHENFAHLRRELIKRQLAPIDGILFDLGVSSPQLDCGERGFSYRHDAPLDMRMDRSLSKTAADLVRDLPAEELAAIIGKYGEERWAKRIAEFIVKNREVETIHTTGDLVRIIKAAVPMGARRGGRHPARRTFQALRIAVNRELEHLEKALRDAVMLLGPRGRIAVISFHSLEDRIVKDTFRELAAGCQCPPGLPVCVCGKRPMLRLLTRRPMVPQKAEITDNPRARSAKLRVAERVLGEERDEY